MAEPADERSYLQWLSEDTPTRWWHDSGDPGEIRDALEHGATGITTNPILAFRTIDASPALWLDGLREAYDGRPDPERVEALTRAVALGAAESVAARYTGAGSEGFVCAQVDPAYAGSRDAMVDMARRFSAWAPNIAVKLPATLAGLQALEVCASEGITTTATVSFTVPQAIEIAERFRRGLAKAREAGLKDPRCFAVLMTGRLDVYLDDIAADLGVHVGRDGVIQAGNAVAKRAYDIYRERGYEATLLIAGLRGIRHVEQMAGAEVVISISPAFQEALRRRDVPKIERYEEPVDPALIDTMRTIPEFNRIYEPDGMAPEEFMAFGLTQRTLAQFTEAGWGRMLAHKFSP